MSRLYGNKGRRGAAGVLEADVRLTDYAHAPLSAPDKSRVSKNAANATAKAIRETKHWWECEDDEFLDDFGSPDNDIDEEENLDDELSSTNDQISKQSFRKGSSPFTDSEFAVELNQYPIDLWFLISEYIKPEDICRFALICRLSYKITKSSGFWRQLYRKYIDRTLALNLPEQFRPLALRRPYGLRTRVIKALNLVYAPFLERSKIQTGVSLSTDAVTKLCRRTCESTWWEQQRDSVNGKIVWKFYFKFRGRHLSSSNTSLPQQNRVHNWKIYNRNSSGNASSLDYLDDTWANLEEDCCILKIACHQYTQISTSILGWHLSELNISLCSDMRNHRLRLIFSESNAKKSGSSKISGVKEIAILDNVQSVAMFDWWHPNYPSAVL